ncbi:MAG: Gfo/Idh/MocA family oxidoreductase [Chloroflexi bacterium]|nr:Gfo/Idh/MocA family oxidoreductase [Chloroflexota bacterium]
MNIAIVGCGLIAQKRAAGLGAHRLVACCDISQARAEALAGQHSGCVATTDARVAIERPDVDAVVVATTHDGLASTALLAIESGKHVLVEKPAGRRASEVKPLIAAAVGHRVTGKVGFNHRFHPAFQRARALVDAGEVGSLVYIRGRYGHGGRLGYASEWRADPRVSGGGELLDQGSHLIDLARWFMGEFVSVAGHLGTYFWDMPVEDNAFMLLKTAEAQVAWLHASWTEWKNLFSFEIFGKYGKLQIDGLGGSYGTERLTFYRMLPEVGPPETTIWEYPGADRSWANELKEFMDCIASGEQPTGTFEDAVAVLEIVEALYAARRASE